MRSGCSLCSGGGNVKEGFSHHATHTRLAASSQSVKQRISMFVKQNILSTLLSLIIMGSCIYLSWTCNTKQGIDVIMKVFYAFWAAFFNMFYLIYYFLVRQQSC
jgi:hypothetical protein